MVDAILWTKVLKILKMILITERFFWSLIMNSQLELKNFLSQDGESKMADPRSWVKILKMLKT